MMRKQTASFSDAYILLAPDFDEQTVVKMFRELRQDRFPVFLVSLTPDLVKSYWGLRLHADFFIDQLSDASVPSLIFIPGPAACVAHLVSDPRVDRLLQRTLSGGGFVAASSEGREVLRKVGFAETVSLQAMWPEEETNLGLLETSPVVSTERVSSISSLLNDYR